MILVASMLVGIYVLDIFGISLPIVRIGGGLLVAASGWRMLSSKAEARSSRPWRTRPRNRPAPRSPAAVSSRSRSRSPPARAPSPRPSPWACTCRAPPLYSWALVAALGVAATALVIYLCYRRAAAAGKAGRHRHHRDHAPVRVHPALHRHRDHVDRVGRPAKTHTLRLGALHR